ncbi:MAG TPA: amino acid decarboxylase, partial [Gemmatimonadaceae bacterium]|nr:amino acid decarboxylase [Gemmatimonadaceae bacterium]
MTADLPKHELLSQGRAVLDWIAEYLEHPERYPVLSEMTPGEVRASLPSMPPARGESLDAILEDFRTKIVPGITHW